MDIKSIYDKYFGKRTQTDGSVLGNAQDNATNAVQEPEVKAEKPLPDFKGIADTLLRRLQVLPLWREKDGTMSVCEFDFQSGHFVLRVWDTHPYVLVTFPFFFSANLDDMELVRGVVNRVNMESLFSRTIITTNETNNTIACHVMVNVCLDDTTENRLHNLSDHLISCFSTRHDFDKYIEEARAADDADPELDAAERRRDSFLLYEQAWTHKDERVRVSAYSMAKLTLGEMLRRMFDWHDVEHLDVTLLSGNELQRLSDGTNYEPLNAIVSEGGAVLADEATLLLDVKRTAMQFVGDDRYMEQRQHTKVVMMMRLDHVEEQAIYVSVTLAREGVQTQGIKQLGHPESKGDAVTFIIARDIDDEQSRRRQYEFVLGDAKDKMRQGRDADITATQRYLLSNDFEYGVGYNMFWGMTYARNKRYMEALAHFENALGLMRERMPNLNSAQYESLYNVMYSVGMCYSRLGRYERAFYYLDYAAQGNQNNYVIEYIDCLVNSGDLRADAVLTNTINNVQDHINDNQDNDDFDLDAMQPYLRFLDERRIYLYIEQRRWREAEKMLTRILNEDPENEFAINELAYMNTIRQTDRRKS